MDASAVYFLISELFMAVTCGTLFLINIGALSPTTPWTGVPIFSVLGAEVAILFSILSLTNQTKKSWFILSMLIIGLITTLLEASRGEIELRVNILLISICLTSIFTLNYLVCKFRLPPSLQNNQFMKWFTWFELGMVGYGVMRILGYFAPAPIRPLNTPSTLALVIFSYFVVIGTFRYISYIGLRISWVNPINPTQNPLNKSLVNAIEEKDQLLRGLIASNRVIGISALASSLAHQLSQPLTTIALRADTTRRDLEGATQDPKVLSSLDDISTQSSKLAELIKNLRRLFGSSEYRFLPLNLQKIIEEIIEIVQPSLDAKKITLIKDYHCNPMVIGDSIQLQQVFINILNNAIDSLEQNDTQTKEIQISITKRDKFAIVEFKDNGGGFDQKSVPTIFELYKTTKRDGLGVGLWLSKTIIEQHHGSISAQNDELGHAVLTLEVPLSDSQDHEP
ncbi:sensor histidine kinase [Polynucleobacter ibericus]|uniref:sensor histidine kinase n=1 Tax=Polynucleobacter ibericus TaxID=1819725 RepID=UPI001BFE6B9D|nr:HAMP domain-containing sensor histidine kinase [Polynucleobacter ibericus]QWE07868.1 HAMP domain-containing histidine kinase [Polynucleobacter ibericus]